MRLVKIGGKEYEVSSKIEIGKAVVKKGIVYAVRDDASKSGIYIVDGKAKIKPYPKGKEVTEDQIYEKKEESSLDLFDEILSNKDKIIKRSEKPVLTKEEKNDIFAPPITEEDNILVRIVKSILKEKQINIKVLLPKFKDQMEMNNFKRSLRIHEKMSIERFEKWMDVLECEWDVTYGPRKKK
jgi:hypothetical protein